MNRDERKRQKKHKREKKKELASCARRLRRDLYPAIEFKADEGVHPAFLAAVEQAVKAFRYDDETMCPIAARDFYKVIRKVGWDETIDQWIAAQANGARNATTMSYAVQFMSTHLGNWLFKQVPDAVKQDALPYSIFTTQLGKETIVVQMRAIHKTKGVGGSIFYSQYNAASPLPLAGGEYPLGFSRHAIDQLCLREHNPVVSYRAALHVHEVLSDWTCIEVCKLTDGTPAVSLFSVCGPPTSVTYNLYAKKLLGVTSVDWAKELFAYRLGYCPIVVDNGFAKALTFLYPGYRNTPERMAIVRSRDLANAKRVKWLGYIDKMSVDSLGSEEHGHVVEWFHRHAAVQVYRESDIGKSLSVREYPMPAIEPA
jgi:hypothetical protein